MKKTTVPVYASWVEIKKLLSTAARNVLQSLMVKENTNDSLKSKHKDLSSLSRTLLRPEFECFQDFWVNANIISDRNSFNGVS